MTDPEIIAGVGELIGEGVKDGVFVSGEGLKPSSERVHIAYRGGQRTITDGPFTEAKELVAGFWLIQARSKDEAVEWARRAPFVDGEIEVRQVFELERSEERRVGKECSVTCRSRWSPYH